jgi:hypothetical protein
MRFFLVLLSFLLLLSLNSWAQVCPGCPELPPPDPGAPVPLTGFEYLIVAGGIFGISKIWKSLKTKDN